MYKRLGFMTSMEFQEKHHSKTHTTYSVKSELVELFDCEVCLADKFSEQARAEFIMLGDG